MRVLFCAIRLAWNFGIKKRMASDSEQQSHTPDPESEGDRLVYEAGVSFLPPLRLDSTEALSFASKLSEHIPPSSVQIESNQWVYSAASGVELKVTPTRLLLTAHSPSVPRQEPFEQRFQVILTRFKEVFNPKFIASSRALMCAIVPIDGDARVFLGGHLLRFHPRRLLLFGRPAHGLGIRFFFPQYEQESNGTVVDSVNWHANVKIESWLEDPSKLFVEVEGVWPNPEEWEETSENNAVSRLGSVSDFYQTKLLPFLRANTTDFGSGSGDDDEPQDGGDDNGNSMQ
jgi:hypothetical protein